MTVKQLNTLKANLKGGTEFTHTFKAGANVYCFKGESGSGKTAAENALRLSLLKQVWIDSLGKHIKDTKMICNRLTNGEPIRVTLEHNKGISEVSIAPNKYGRFSRDGWHKGYYTPVGGNLTARIKDILSRTPATMLSMLSDLVISDLDTNEVMNELKTATAKDAISIGLSQGKDVVDSLNAAVENIKEAVKERNAELKPLIAAQDEGAYEVKETVLVSTQEEYDFWVTQRALLQSSVRNEQNSSIGTELRSQVASSKETLNHLFIQRAGLDKVDWLKIEAYNAGKNICDFAAHKNMPICPICSSDKGIAAFSDKKKWEKVDPQKFFQTMSKVFESKAHHEEHKPDATKYTDLTKQIETLQQTLDRAEFALSQFGDETLTEAPQYSIDVIEENIQKASSKLETLRAIRSRFEAQKDRREKIDQVQKRIKHLEETQKDLTACKNKFVNAAVHEFVERARYYMPAPSALRGGVLHFNLDKREVGFLRNGQLEIDPSGSEFRVIVCAMALAAGDKMREPPPVFLDDVGWGVDLLEASLVAWSKYPGIVCISTTAKVRQSKVGKKVEVIDIAQVTPHTKKVAQEVSVQTDSDFVQRPEDNYETSMFKEAFNGLPIGSVVVIEHKQRAGKKTVTQQYKGQVFSNSSKNVTVVSECGSGFSIDKTTGKAAFNQDSQVKRIETSALLAHYKQTLSEFLGFPPDFNGTLEQVKAVWDNQISYADLADRADLIPS